ncbi:hypothetical protein [Nocardiopsis chromatogenes]|uniref:hypothetical protein n=1 Tax=Nocardiopsis chromatogenes TaxID=280239 RepID=UPI0003460DDF|nr:hypothetical protein [Nocardiopsis chromatogenes]
MGHNVGVEWKLLHRHHPGLRPAGLVDTLKLARNTGVAAPRGLGALLDRFDLRGLVGELVPDGRPHRALWDTVGAAVLLQHLAQDFPEVPTVGKLLEQGEVPVGAEPDEATLF